MKKKIIPICIGAGVIFLIIAAIVIGISMKKYAPTKEKQNVYQYFNISGISDDEAYQKAVRQGESVVPIELNRTLTEEKAFSKDGQMYLNYDYIHSTLNQRFYWDKNENVLLYTTTEDVIKAEADSKDYYIGKKKTSKDYPIVLLSGENAYVALDFVKEYTNLEYEICEKPTRVLLQNEWGTVQKSQAKRSTEVRVRGGVKSKVLAEIKKNDPLVVQETYENWSQVATEDGWIGYVLNKYMTEPEEETENHVDREEEFYHQTRDKKINMAWHQVTNTAANTYVASVLQEAKGVNVLSPTWFYLDDNEGNITRLASMDYVKYCHDHDVEVWALVSNLENPNVDTTEILTHTSKRENLTNQIIAAAIQYNLDGINVDFESLSQDTGEGFIQFIRELSLKCEDNGLVLSVDNYVSSEYTKFYNRQEQANFADYIVIMAYDEHFDGSETAGSVASLGFVEKACSDILEEDVAPERVILGMPFYTRVWMETPVQVKTGKGGKKTKSSYELSSQAISMTEAENRVSTNGAKKKWLADQGQYYAEYKNSGITYKIWMEDAASIEEKLKLMQKYEFAGASFWKLGLEDQKIWDTIIKYM